MSTSVEQHVASTPAADTTPLPSAAFRQDLVWIKRLFSSAKTMNEFLAATNAAAALATRASKQVWQEASAAAAAGLAAAEALRAPEAAAAAGGGSSAAVPEAKEEEQPEQGSKRSRDDAEGEDGGGAHTSGGDPLTMAITISGLPIEGFTWLRLKSALSKLNVKQVKFIDKRDEETFGVLRFDSPEAANEALALISGAEVEGVGALAAAIGLPEGYVMSRKRTKDEHEAAGRGRGGGRGGRRGGRGRGGRGKRH
ncbi:MAG: hypothetical protein WDW38_002642 [Sanguina aurantia]